jgi:hypothetical protein
MLQNFIFVALTLKNRPEKMVVEIEISKTKKKGGLFPWADYSRLLEMHFKRSTV